MYQPFIDDKLLWFSYGILYFYLYHSISIFAFNWKKAFYYSKLYQIIKQDKIIQRKKTKQNRGKKYSTAAVKLSVWDTSRDEDT